MPVDDVKAQAGFQLELLGGHLEHPRDGITGGARDQHTRDALIQDERGIDGLIVDGFFGGGISGVRVEREPAVRGPLERREQDGLLSRAADEADGDAMRCRPAEHEAVGGGEDRRHPDGDRDDDHRVPVRGWWRQGFVLAGGHVGGCRSPSAASRPARCGTTTYFGSLVDATPASKVPKRCNAEPASRARPPATATRRLRRAPDTARTAPPSVRYSDDQRRRCARPVVYASVTDRKSVV